MILDEKHCRSQCRDLAWENKCWGRTQCIIDGTPYYQKHFLELVKGGFCSFHYHRNRTNSFQVFSGLVRIVLVRGINLETVILNEHSEEFFIEPEVAHQFQVLETGVMVEEYFSRRGHYVTKEDIYRMTTGGFTSKPNFFSHSDRIWFNDNSTAKPGWRNVIA